MFSKAAILLAASATVFAEVPDVISIKTSPIAGCGFNKTVSWGAIPQGCVETPDIEGGSYYPSLVFHLEKELDAGVWTVVDNSKHIARCNSDGLPNTENAYIWNVPKVLPAAYKHAGGPGYETNKRFRIGAWFLSAGSGTTFDFAPITFSAGCTFEEGAATGKECTGPCFGPTARCMNGMCTCAGKYNLVDGGCTLATDAPTVPVAGDEGEDCKAAEPRCNVADLECATDGKCRSPEEAVVIDCSADQAKCDAECASRTECGGCKSSAQDTGIACSWCAGEGEMGTCVASTTCATGTLLPLAEDCPQAGAPVDETTAAPPSGGTTAAPVAGGTTAAGATTAASTEPAPANVVFVSAVASVAAAIAAIF